MQISKKYLFDFAIIGAGISGACMAYFLRKYGKKVIVIDKGKIASGGSGAAGAFLSPKICSNSSYTSFINESFRYSIEFYEKNFSQFLDKSGILRILKNQEDIEKCKLHEKNLPDNFEYLKPAKITNLRKKACEFGGYYFKDGAIVDSVNIIKKILKDVDVIEGLHVESLNYANGYYEIGDIRAKGIVLCAGNTKDFPHIKYCGLKNIYGHRVDVKTNLDLGFHIHKSCSISANDKGIVYIGATHVPNYKYKDSANYDKEINDMINLAKSYVKFDGFEVKNIHFGVRNSTIDYFPVLGEVIDAEKTLQKYPYIKKGSLVPKEKYTYFPNLYIHAGLGARGFVLAPKTAEILAKNMCDSREIDKKLDTTRLFLKYAKKTII